MVVCVLLVCALLFLFDAHALQLLRCTRARVIQQPLAVLDTLSARRGFPTLQTSLLRCRPAEADAHPPESAILRESESSSIDTLAQLQNQTAFLVRAGLVGVCTALCVVIFKLSIQEFSIVLYEKLADILPKDPGFYWPQILFPVLGSLTVSLLTLTYAGSTAKGIDDIARSIDGSTTENTFKPLDQLARLGGGVATLGSGCSLGPEGPSVEIGASMSRIFGGNGCSLRQQHHLFLAGTAAGVASGFNAPFTGIFFALECGNRFLKKNTVTLTEESVDGPRSDIAAIVIAACVASLVVKIGLNEKNALSITGNVFAMQSPLFELPFYLGLGLVSGSVATAFSFSRDYFRDVFASDNVPHVGESTTLKQLVSPLPVFLRPLLGGLLCGIVGLRYPQTLFVGYQTLDSLIAGKINLPLSLLAQLLTLKIFLSAFCSSCGLVGGVFAPSLFMGAIAGTIYHDVVLSAMQLVSAGLLGHVFGNDAFFSISSAPAYATVGASSVLGALFRAPLTSSILFLELTENHDIVLPVLLSSGVAGFFAEITSSKK